MLATQKGRSKPVRMSCQRCAKLKVFSLGAASANFTTEAIASGTEEIRDGSEKLQCDSVRAVVKTSLHQPRTARNFASTCAADSPRRESAFCGWFLRRQW